MFALHTRHSRRGWTRPHFRNHGLEAAAAAGNAALACFEEAGHDAYFAADPPGGSHFKKEIFLPTAVRNSTP